MKLISINVEDGKVCLFQDRIYQKLMSAVLSKAQGPLTA